MNFFDFFIRGATDLLTTRGDIFVPTGLRMFRAVALIMLVYFGLRVALTRQFRLDKFVGLLMMISAGYTMLYFYSNPIPGFGISFRKAIADFGLDLANQIEMQTTESVVQRFGDLITGLQPPPGSPVLHAMDWAYYYATTFVLSFAEAAVLFIISYGFIALAVCSLFGPIFIPFFIVPKLEWIFWGWLKTFIQYAFYPAVASAVVYILAQAILNFANLYRPPWDTTTIAVMFTFVLSFTIAFIFCMLKVPSLSAAHFTGRAGDHAFPGLGWYR